MKQPCGVKVNMKSFTKYSITWAKTKGAKKYKVSVKGKNKKTKLVKKNKVTFKGLKEGYDYTLKITPLKKKKKKYIKGATTHTTFYTGLKEPEFYEYNFNGKSMSITYETQIGNVDIELFKAKEYEGTYEKVSTKQHTYFCDTDNYAGTPPVLTPAATFNDPSFVAGNSFLYKARVRKKIGKKTYYSDFSPVKEIYAKYIKPVYDTKVIEKDDDYVILQITSSPLNYTTDIRWPQSDDYKLCWSLNPNRYDEELDDEKHTDMFLTFKAGKTVYAKLTFKKNLSAYKDETYLVANGDYRGHSKTNNFRTPYSYNFQYSLSKNKISIYPIIFIG